MTSDIEEIRRLHHAYAYAFDSGDIDAFAALFEHGTLHLQGVDDPATGSAAVRRLVERCVILYDGRPATNHLMHNLVVDVADDGETARATTYVQVLQGLPDFPPQTIATGIYHDVLRRRDGAWTFEERVTEGSLRGDLSRHLRRRRDRPPR
jgi:ketosteroid isomerase-like protein